MPTTLIPDGLPDLTHYLDGALAEREQNEDPRTYLGISQLGRCARATGYAMQPELYPAEAPIDSLRFWNEGNVAEADIVARLRAGGCPVFNAQFEVTFPEGHPLHGRALGHMDGEVSVSPSLALATMTDIDEGHEFGVNSPWNDEMAEEPMGIGDLAVLEIKSLRVGALKKLYNEGSVSMAWPQYGIQAHTYAFCRGRKWVCFLVKDRNSGDIVCTWEEAPNMALVEAGVAQGEKVLAALDAGLIPGRDYDPAKDWQCKSQYCQWRNYCLQQGV